MYELYKKARDAAWQALINCGINTLPVNLNTVAEHYGYDVVLYSHCPMVQILKPDAAAGDGFITMFNGNTVIFLNDQIKTKGRRRFTLAHEIGHGVLGGPLDVIRYRNSEQDNDSPIETACNIFARDLLAPAGVLAALNVHTPEEIMRLCDISRVSAEIRAERMKVLYERGMFGAHPLERQVIKQFGDFIQRHCGRRPKEYKETEE